MNAIRRLLPRTIMLACGLLLLQSCTMGGEWLKEANSIKDVSKDEVIVVGTIELSPGLQEGEQALDPDGIIDLFGYGDMNKNKSIVQFNSQPKVDSYKLVINPELGKTFFFKVPKDKKYMVEASILTSYGRYGAKTQILLPMSFKVDIKKSDKAVYIGKIKYTRDDFNSVTKVELVDDYKKAKKQFKKKFGNKYKLRKALVKKI